MSAPIESPCRNLCELSPTSDLCRGCHRSLDEITRWRGLSGAERRRIMESLPSRQPG